VASLQRFSTVGTVFTIFSGLRSGTVIQFSSASTWITSDQDAAKARGQKAMAKIAHASQSAARLLHKRYGGAIVEPTALPRMPACKCNNSTASLPF